MTKPGFVIEGNKLYIMCYCGHGTKVERRKDNDYLLERFYICQCGAKWELTMIIREVTNDRPDDAG